MISFEEFWTVAVKWLVHQSFDLNKISIGFGFVAAILVVMDIFFRQLNNPLTRLLHRLWRIIDSSSWLRIPESLVKFYISISGGLYYALTRLVGTIGGVSFLIVLTPVLNWLILTKFYQDIFWPKLLACSIIPWLMTFVVLKYSPLAKKVLELNLSYEKAQNYLSIENNKLVDFSIKTGIPIDAITTETRESIIEYLEAVNNEMNGTKSEVWGIRVYSTVVLLRPITVLICLYLLFSPVFKQIWLISVRDALIVMACLLPSIFLVVEVIVAIVGLSVMYSPSGTESLQNSYAKSLRSIHWSANFSLGFAMSLMVTFIALDVGMIIEPLDVFHISTQFLLTNFLCDGLTLWFTVQIMIWAVSSYALIKLPIAIGLDISVAVILAMASIFLGLLGSPAYEISWQEAWNILSMNNFNFAMADFGPKFWVMHTTFLPTLAYCILIALGWIGKLILYIWMIFFKRAIDDRPLALTASLFGAIAAIIQGYIHFF
jgi:hypothetical protein